MKKLLDYLLIELDAAQPMQLLFCSAASVVLGIVVALIYTYKNVYTKSMVMTLALMPLAVQMVIFLINGQIGAGIAIAGAFGLVRFRSASGSARDIVSVFMTMALGIANGMGYLGIAVFFVLIYTLMSFILCATSFGEMKAARKVLKITIPESLDYSGIFDDVFKKYVFEWELSAVKTVNLGSLFELRYNITLKDIKLEKSMLDEIRVRNGNLSVICANFSSEDEAL